MTVKRFGIAVWLLVCGLCFWIPQSVHAVALAESNISFSNLQIVPADPAGTVELLSPWELPSFAEAKNSRGDLYQASISNVTGGITVEEGTGSASFSGDINSNAVSADASVPWAAGHGDASAPANPPDLNVTANTNGIVDIPDHVKDAWAASDGSGSLFNLFTITGGTGSVAVDFSVDIAAFLHVLTTNTGILAETEATFTLEVFNLYTGDLELFLDVDSHLRIGPNSEQLKSFSITLDTAAEHAIPSLIFDIPYSVSIGAISESFGVVPEPPTLALISLGVFILTVSSRKKLKSLKAS